MRLWTLGVVDAIFQLVLRYSFRVLESLQRADELIAGFVPDPYKLCSSLELCNFGYGVPLS
jgi:hypothetical protein